MRFSLTAAAAIAAFGLAGCAAETTTAPDGNPAAAFSVGSGDKSYVIDMQGNSLPVGLEAAVAAAGGTLTGSAPEIGVAFATSGNQAFAKNLGRTKGIRAVTPDTVVQWVPEMKVVELDAEQLSHGDNETFWNLQWAPRSIGAPEAWHLGHIGTGARVAVLDGGIHSTHIDLASRLDIARSKSFVAGQAFNADVGTFWHGTHVAGIVAGADNGIGTIGIAPGATIIGVKVLHNGTGSFAGVIQGIVYAATPIAEGGAGAHIINLSLGGNFAKNGSTAALHVALNKATIYARQRGVTVIAALGNDAIDLDHTANLVSVPAQSTGVIAVSSTGPLGFGQGATNFSRPASYTNFGQSATSLAGPGGDFVLPGTAICSYQRVNPPATSLQFCWVLDMVMGPSRGTGASISTYSWAAGTSAASPAVAGVAALIVGKNGPMDPAHLEALLRASADDLGKPGNDDFYGAGYVNALRAVQ